MTAGESTASSVVEDVNDTASDEPKKTKRGRPRSGRAVARHLDRDQELLVIAADVFYKLGFEGTRLDDIAAEAGIVKGTLYHYFDSKEHIYQLLVETIKGSFDANLDVPRSLPPEQRLEIFTRARAAQVAASPVELGIFARQMVRMEGPIGDWARDLAKTDLATLRNIIVQGQKAGTFRAGDPDLLARMAMGSWIYPVEWYHPSAVHPPEQLVEEIVDFVAAALRTT